MAIWKEPQEAVLIPQDVINYIERTARRYGLRMGGIRSGSYRDVKRVWADFYGGSRICAMVVASEKYSYATANLKVITIDGKTKSQIYDEITAYIESIAPKPDPVDILKAFAENSSNVDFNIPIICDTGHIWNAAPREQLGSFARSILTACGVEYE